MRIVIDARILSYNKHCGIGVSIENLINALAKIDKKNEYIILTSKQYSIDLPGKNFAEYETKVHWKTLKTHWAIPKVLEKLKADVFHATISFAAPLKKVCPTVVSVYDLIHLAVPDFKFYFHKYYYNLVVKKLLKKADRIVTISEHSKKDIYRFFGLDNVDVVYLAANPAFRDLGIEKKGYILVVSNSKKYKNKHIFDGYTDHPVKFTDGHYTLEQLVMLYNEASLVVIPSFYEGFGLPALEAMACGTPIASSNATSLPEIAADAAIYFDPSSQQNMREAINIVFQNLGVQRTLRNAGFERVKQFSWEKTAQKMLKIYREVGE